MLTCDIPMAHDTAGRWVSDPNYLPCTDTALAWMLNTTIWPTLTGGIRFSISYSTDFDSPTNPLAAGLFVGPAGLAVFDSYVGTWVRAMAHPRYMRVEGRPTFKILGPYNFYQGPCSGNVTLAQSLIDRFRAAAVAAGVGNPLIGGGWIANDVPLPTPVYQGIKYDYTGTYNGAARSPSFGPCMNSTLVHPYAQVDAWSNGALWGNHTKDAVPWVPNVISGFDPRPVTTLPPPLIHFVFLVNSRTLVGVRRTPCIYGGRRTP